MKVALLGDTHFGISDGKKLMHDFFEKVYGWFIDELNARHIFNVYQFGDIFDKRKGVDSYSATEAKRYFFDRLEGNHFRFTALVGNHDSFFTNTIEVNSPDLLLQDYENIDLIQHPLRVKIGGVKVDIIPWICRDNQEEITKFIEQSDSEYCFGHFEIAGFAMYKGVESHGGLSAELFKKYKAVYSGHYHTRSTVGNITYIGTPCEMTWNDYNDPRGFHVLDTDTGEIEFVECPHTLFTKIVYNDETLDLKTVPDVKDKFVKLVVEKRTDFKKFDKYVTAINEAGVHDLKIIEDLTDFHEENIDTDKLDLDDTPTLLNNYIDEADTDLDKDRLKREMNLLYVEAKALES
jgi:DNA repair exonuclease SbcCD nuclease subunit